MKDFRCNLSKRKHVRETERDGYRAGKKCIMCHLFYYDIGDDEIRLKNLR
jgi:hypothetical protein